MDNKFNTELTNLVKQAKENGYELKDNQFVKVENGKVPVIEILFINNSTIEEAGECSLYHHTAVIEKDEYDSIVEYGLHNNYHEFYCDYDSCDYSECEKGDPDDILLDLIYEIFKKYDSSGIDYTCSDEGGKITVEYSTDYRIYSTTDKCIDFWFSKMDSNNDFLIGSISFYYMEMSDFERRKNTDVDIKIKKFMRWN